MWNSVKQHFKFLLTGSEKMLDKIFVFKYFPVFYVTRLQLHGFLESIRKGA
jgi:hypothetical protein